MWLLLLFLILLFLIFHTQVHVVAPAVPYIDRRSTLTHAGCVQVAKASGITHIVLLSSAGTQQEVRTYGHELCCVLKAYACLIEGVPFQTDQDFLDSHPSHKIAPCI